jgi:aryl-alcohol dehydrogenase-like predicted oxidoreductase
MQTRTLGRTGLPVTRIGIGLAALGRPAYINLGHAEDLERTRAVEALRQRTADVLDAAWDAGIRYVDAARSYGRAEEFLASWLDGRPADRRPTIGSKWGYEYVGGWRLDAEEHEVKEHSLEMFRRQRDETAALLGDDLDLYQVHSLTLSTGALDDAALLDALADLRASGTAVGMSLSGPQQAATLERALTIERDGVGLFSAVQATWNVLEPSAGAMLAAAHEAGVGVIVKEGVANGRLTPRGPDDAVRAVLDPIAARTQVTVDAVALAAVLAEPWVDVVLSGVATVAHLRDNLRAFDVGLTAEDRAALAALAEPADRYWDRRSALAWR